MRIGFGSLIFVSFRLQKKTLTVVFMLILYIRLFFAFAFFFL